MNFVSRGELRREILERFLISRHDDRVESVFGKDSCEVAPDADAGAGDQCGGTVGHEKDCCKRTRRLLSPGVSRYDRASCLLGTIGITVMGIRTARGCAVIRASGVV